MNICLLHLDTQEIADYGDLSLRSKYEYAARWGFDVSTVRGKICKDRPASWSKILLCQQVIDRYEWIWWLDADATITNKEIDIRQFCDESADMIATKDENGINAGSFLLRNSAGAKNLLAATWERTEFIDHPWWEQAALQAVLADGIAVIKEIDKRAINSYPKEWKPGDLVVHFAGMQNRMRWFRKYPPFPSDVSIDECHGDLLYGMVVSQKPLRILELGIGSGCATSILLRAIKYNGYGRLTCVDNFSDWNGKPPLHAASLGCKIVIQDESAFLRSCPSDSYDLIVSDADHGHASEWIKEYFRVANEGAFLFFHDTNNQDYPNLRRIVEMVAALPHYHFTRSSRQDERCGRGWLWAINQKPIVMASGDAKSDEKSKPSITRVSGKKHRAVIQLGSTGDLVNLLPCCKAWHDAGEEVYIVTNRGFATDLDAVSYVKTIPVDFSIRYVFMAEKWAIDSGCFDEVTVTQVFGNDRRYPVGPKNWQVGEWVRCGMLERFHELPTIFDRRDRDAERIYMAMHMPVDNGLPLLAYNLNGVSQPYPYVAEQREWITRTFGASHRLIDLGALRLDSPASLLPFIEAAEVLVTVDTCTVHLAHATDTPVIVFHPENEFARSEPRVNWVYACTHRQSIEAEHREAIRELFYSNQGGRLIRSTAEMVTPFVWHAVEYHWDDDLPEEKARQMAAYKSWESIRMRDRYFRTVFTERPGATRVEIIDKAIAMAQPDDCIIWTSRFAHLNDSLVRIARDQAGRDECPDGQWMTFRAKEWARMRDDYTVDEQAMLHSPVLSI